MTASARNCQFCPRWFDTSQAARIHEEIDHASKEATACAVCGAVFATGKGATRHKATVHDAPRPVPRPAVHARTACPWPGCGNDKPSPWAFCNGRDCQSQRMTARLSEQIYDRESGEWLPITAAHREVMDLKERKYKEQHARWAQRAAEWRRENPDKVAAQKRRAYRRLAGIREAHRRRMDRINLRNQLARKAAWERAMSEAGDDLLALIQEQQEDERRKIVGDRYAVRLDATWADGDSREDFYTAFRNGHGPWADPVFDAVVVRLEIEERWQAEVEPSAERVDLLPWSGAPDPRMGYNAWDRRAS